MRKITKLIFVCICILSINFSYGQTGVITSKDQINTVKPTKKKNSNSSNVNGNLQLNEENQRFLNENGVVRCLTEEYNEQLRANNPNRRSKQQFEDWLAPLVQSYKAEQAARVASGNASAAQMPVYNIPIIFHVVSGSPGDAADLDAQYVNAQIDQLNLDFSNQAGAASGPWAAVAADAQIVFVPAQVDPSGNPLAEPGINRVYGYPGQLSQADFENTIKPATIWDRTLYCNNWTGNLGGGLLGYAQFPEGSTLPGMPTTDEPNNTDGVVCLYTSIGSVANPHPNGGVYAAGRTLTHEIGHWIGLRHIWGDGNCNVDDFCNDTPTQGGSSSGCPTTADTCNDGAGDQRDMVENYMDYSYDTCMNIFTADQVARMVTVMQNSPGRSELPNSTTGNAPSPSVSFAVSSANVVEGSDCSFTDVTVDLSIAQGPSQNATANVSVNGGTADSNDFVLLNNVVNFSAGATANQSVTLRVYNDDFIEGDETIDLTFTLNNNGGDATVGNSAYTLTINDDDILPTQGGNLQDIFSDDFESGFGQWTVTGAPSATDFAIGNNTTFPDAGYFNPTGNATNYAYINDDDCNCDMSDERMEITGGVDLTNYSSAEVSFDYSFDDTYGGTLTLELSLDGGATWPLAAQLATTGTGTAQNVPFQTITIDLSAYVGQVVHLSIHYNDDGGWAQGVVVDNFAVRGPGPRAVQTAVNSTVSNDFSILPSAGTIYPSDSGSNDVMLGITNNDGFDYGCVDSSVSRSGTNAQSYNGSAGTNLVMDKTFTITPTNTTNSGNNTVEFYVTAAEVAGFTGATGLTVNDIYAHRAGSDDVVALTATPFGSDYSLSGDFTGLNGTYYLGAEGAFRSRVSPRLFLSGAFSGTLMNDDLRSNGYIPTTSPYSDAITCDAAVFNVTGNDAIVDWVWVELRDATNNTTISASTSALLQRDGDVVDVDGVSPLTLTVPGKDYFVVVNHRNHLGTMSLNTVALTATASVVDFTNGLSTFGSNGQTDLGSGVMGLWAGNVDGNTSIQYSGANADSPTLLSFVLNDSGNFLNTATYSVSGYSNYDINMDGNTQYTGATPDTPKILQLVLSHPGNFLNTTTYEITEQLPQ